MQLVEFVIKPNHKSLTHLTDQRLHTDWQQKALTKLMGLQYKLVYKKGIHNGAADALSRKPPASSELFAASTVQPVWLDRVIDSYAEGVKMQELLQRLAVDPSSEPNFSLKNGLIRYQGRICMGCDDELKLQIIRVFHASPVGGHSGFPVTYRRIAALFKWPGMTVKTFVSQCITCQQCT